MSTPILWYKILLFINTRVHFTPPLLYRHTVRWVCGCRWEGSNETILFTGTTHLCAGRPVTNPRDPSRSIECRQWFNSTKIKLNGGFWDWRTIKIFILSFSRNFTWKVFETKFHWLVGVMKSRSLRNEKVPPLVSKEFWVFSQMYYRSPEIRRLDQGSCKCIGIRWGPPGPPYLATSLSGSTGSDSLGGDENGIEVHT